MRICLNFAIELLRSFANFSDTELSNPDIANAINYLIVQSSSYALATATISSSFVAMLFAICSKIRQQPAILDLWLLDSDSADTNSLSTVDFPIFRILVNYVYQDGEVGDYARTGILYLIEICSQSPKLVDWIINGDCGTLLASGLGALYSQLSRQVTKAFNAIDDPMIVSLVRSPSSNTPTSSSNSSSFSTLSKHKEFFQIYLLFWQDMLYHCYEPTVYRSLLSHYYSLFLCQLLYPSLIESSDFDGSQSSLIAVLTYIRSILDTFELNDLSHLSLSYMMNISHESFSLSKFTSQEPLSPDLCALSDIIFTSLKSPSDQTMAAGLRLIQVILHKYYPYAVNSLIHVSYIAQADAVRYSDYLQLLRLLSAPAVNYNSPQITDSQSYDCYLDDAYARIQAQQCTPRPAFDFHSLNNPKFSKRQNSLCTPPRCYYGRVKPNDFLIENLSSMLSTFFTNSVEINLTLTEVISELACCSYLSLVGWLMPSVEPMTDPVLEKTPDLQTDDLGDCSGDEIYDWEDHEMPNIGPSTYGSIYTALQSLYTAYQALPSRIPDFAEAYTRCSSELQMGDDLNDALNDMAFLPKKSRTVRKQRSLDSIRNTSSRSSNSKFYPLSVLKRTSESIKINYSNLSFGEMSKSSEAPLSPVLLREIPLDESIVKPQSSDTISSTASVVQLIVNVLIYEEFLKELCAIVQARATLVDTILY
ncbi:hypothetical protein CANCADRAFT_3754 [Tortispora caseinolytica NRRL Y-17796]|uniref:FHF complex subunit HOOK-interacting protein C-terminal domain-containing protein n=1 Tax=Tortispora caseinolytica NRRL Y-17796 TaxID=767744 RepID=A0A1E4TBT3_9ASCO|nr:hypothetical protein CANCADRAFT_3754 [Tortispora caseinolytica NRRL Y-17796]